jgi:hypothetical protein
MINPGTGIEQQSPALEQAARELLAAQHGERVALDCIALGDLDRAHTYALTARVAVHAAVTALMAALGATSETSETSDDTRPVRAPGRPRCTAPPEPARP